MPWRGSKCLTQPLARLLVSVVVLSGLLVSSPAISRGQSAADAVPVSGANADIVKMLEAGLSESVIVNKIHEGAGKWDTSVDAIIALKKAGATETELATLTSAPASAVQSAALAGPPQVLGGFISRQRNVVIFSLPSSQRAGAFVLNFQVVTVGDHLGLKLSTEGVLQRHPNYNAGVPSGDLLTYGDIIFDRQRVIYYPYIDAGSPFGNPFPTWTITVIKQPVAFEASAILPVYTPTLSKSYGAIAVSEDFDSVGQKEYNYRDLWQITNLFPVKPSKNEPQWGFRFGDVYDQSPSSANARQTFDLIIHSPDLAIQQILQAASISSGSVSSEAKNSFTPFTPEQLAPVIASRNSVIAQRYQNLKSSGSRAQFIPSDGGGGTSGFLAFMSLAQGMTSMVQATRAGTTASITGNTAGQIAAMQQQVAAQTQIANALSGSPSAPMQPATPTDPNAIQDAANQQLANIQAAQARAAAAQSTTQKPQAAATSPFKYTPPQPNPGGFVNSGPIANAPPPDCVAVDTTKPCIPLAQYKAWQAAIDAAPIDIPPPSNCYNQMPNIAENDNFWQAADPNIHLCPRAGYITTGYYSAPDAFIGQRISCVVGRQEVFTWSAPNCPTASGSEGAATNGGGSQNSNPHHLISPGDLNRCIAFDFNGKTPLGPTGWDRYTDNCGSPVSVTIIFGSGAGGASRLDLDPGQSSGTANSSQDYSRLGGSKYYTCPGGYGAADLNGNYLNTPLAQYMCRQYGS